MSHGDFLVRVVCNSDHATNGLWGEFANGLVLFEEDPDGLVRRNSDRGTGSFTRTVTPISMKRWTEGKPANCSVAFKLSTRSARRVVVCSRGSSRVDHPIIPNPSQQSVLELLRRKNDRYVPIPDECFDLSGIQLKPHSETSPCGDTGGTPSKG